MRSDRAILLVNTGSVAEPTPAAVRAFLAQFLNDPLVMKLPWIKRQCLLHAIVLRTRPPKVARMYEEIWGEDDLSPLHRHSVGLQRALQNKVGDSAHVLTAMRYGEPCIREAVRKLKRLRIRQLAIFPLYPQFSEATTLTAVREVERCLKREKLFFQTSRTLAPFFSQSEYIDALYERSVGYLKDFDKLVISFHGLPQSEAAERYREQCLSTARSLCTRAGVDFSRAVVCFQSKFGKGRWLEPSTREVLETLPQKGMRRVVVISPSFVCDSLESLYELGVMGKKIFTEAGGTRFTLVPCLNDFPRFVAFLARQAEKLLEQ